MDRRDFVLAVPSALPEALSSSPPFCCFFFLDEAAFFREDGGDLFWSAASLLLLLPSTSGRGGEEGSAIQYICSDARQWAARIDAGGGLRRQRCNCQSPRGCQPRLVCRKAAAAQANAKQDGMMKKRHFAIFGDRSGERRVSVFLSLSS